MAVQWGVIGPYYLELRWGVMTDPWDDVYLPIHEWLNFMVNVGTYASPMDAMGYIDFRSSRKCVDFFWGVQLKAILQFPDNSRNTNQCKKGDETSGKCEVVTFFLSKVSMCSPPFCS